MSQGILSATMGMLALVTLASFVTGVVVGHLSARYRTTFALTGPVLHGLMTLAAAGLAGLVVDVVQLAMGDPEVAQAALVRVAVWCGTAVVIAIWIHWGGRKGRRP